MFDRISCLLNGHLILPHENITIHVKLGGDYAVGLCRRCDRMIHIMKIRGASTSDNAYKIK